MPDESNRIRKTSFNAMNNILFLLNVMNKKASSKDHPKILVIFNDVSKQYIFSDETEELKKNHQGNSDYQERIKVYKNGLKEFLKEFYL